MGLIRIVIENDVTYFVKSRYATSQELPSVVKPSMAYGPESLLKNSALLRLLCTGAGNLTCPIKMPDQGMYCR